jgi:phosphoglycerate dehydrogenase-like enzyme
MKLLVCDPEADARATLLQSLLRTEWHIEGIHDFADRARARAAIADADALIATELPPDVADAAGRLRLVQCPGAGVDGFDLAVIPEKAVLCNVYEHAAPIAEYVMLNVLLFATRQLEVMRAFRAGRWEHSGRFAGTFHDELGGKTLGLVGYGHIGRAVVRRARAFGMRCVAITRTPQTHPELDACGRIGALHLLLAEADYVVIACPLTPQTRGLLSAAELRLLKPTAILINPARAEIVDEQALYTALRDRWFAGAALDVWYQYPRRRDETARGSRLPFHELDNVIATPHFAAWTEATIRRRYQRIAENLDRLAANRPLLRIVHPAASYPAAE